MKEKRSLYEMVFGKPKPQDSGQTLLRMLNGFMPSFTLFSGDAYDSDVVRAAVDAIARNAAKLKPKHIRRTAGKIASTESNIEKLLQLRPNPYMDAFSFYYKVITQLYLKNNAFIYIDIDPIDGVKAFYPINASTVELLEKDGVIFARFRFLGGQIVVLPYTDLIHLRRFFYSNDMFGETSDKALNPTLELINTTNQGIINAVKSSAFLRGLLKFTTSLRPEDLKKQKDDFVKDYMTMNNDGGIAATDAKADYQELKSEPKMINGSQMKLIEEKVYKYFNVNASIVMSDYNEQQWNSFYESVLEPIAIQMSLEFTAKLFTDRQKGFGNEIIFEANRLQYASNTTKISLITTLMDRGLLSMNEAREIFNLGPVEDGDKRLITLNLVDASKANQYQLGKADPAPGNTEEGQGNDNANDTTGS